ncbi:MAG: hypothetical protein COA38_06635 [Fluviicola sp.]|nr:MAG: hypothetical protein COA38_06635 [Fluviicola sp.]
MKRIALTIAATIILLPCWGQNLNEVVNDSYHSSSEKIYISNESKTMYFGNKNRPMKDSLLIQTPKNYTLYLQAYNPLLKSHNIESKIINDDLQVALEKALSEISSNLTTFFSEMEKPDSQGNKMFAFTDETCGCQCNMFTDNYEEFLEKEEAFKKYFDELSKRKFVDRLAKLPFTSHSRTLDSVSAISDEFFAFQKSIQLKQADIDKLIGDQETGCDETYTYILKDYKEKLTSQLKVLEEKVDAVGKVITTLADTVKEWGKNGVKEERNGLWYFSIKSGEHKRGKSLAISLTIKEHSELKSGSLVKKEKVIESSYQFHLRKYRLLLPEISAGVIYTSIITPSYALGEGSILERTDDHSLERFKFSQMINGNFNIANSNLLPFIQGGVALRNDIPVVIGGIGLRIKTSSKSGISISGGVAMSGVKKLTTLIEGQVITDNVTLENDLKYDFIAKPYIGIQYNF